METETILQEILETELPETESVVLTDGDAASVYVQHLEQIAGDVRIILLFTILTFCTACMRAWRKNIIKGVR